MKAIVFASGIALGLATTSFAVACSYCGDPDLLPDGPIVGPAPVLTRADEEEGFYVVNKAYTGNTVTTTGDTTTYGFTTVDVTRPTSVARDISIVGTGEASFADGTSSNLRPMLSDGRLVAGTYVDSYVIDTNGNKIWIDRTFLPDDSELAKDAARTTVPADAPVEATPATPPAQIPAAEPAQPVLPSNDLVSVFDGTPAVTALDTTSVAPTGPIENEWVPQEPQGPGQRPADVPSTPDPASRAVRAGVALGPQADVLSGVEILRGRDLRLWIRATVDGVPARVIAWRLVSGDVTALGPVAGSGDDPFLAQWLAVGRPGDTFVLRFDAVVEVGSATATATATIAISVRSPAIVE